MWIPFVGMVELNPHDVVGNKLALTYYVNLVDGSAIAQVINCANCIDGVIFAQACDWGVEIPIRADARADAVMSAAMVVGKTIGGIAGGAIGGVPGADAGLDEGREISGVVVLHGDPGLLFEGLQGFAEASRLVPSEGAEDGDLLVSIGCASLSDEVSTSASSTGTRIASPPATMRCASGSATVSRIEPCSVSSL